MTITIVDVAYALWFIFPAYCANAVPVIFGGGFPLDGGRTFFDGKPILGSHKTLRGFLSGLVVGTLVGFLQTIIFQLFLSKHIDLLGIRFRYNVMLGFMLSLGALVGDMIESFIKRRLDLPPGSSLPIADQLDFVAGALLLSPPVSQSSLSLLTIVLIIVLTPPIHFLANLLAAFLRVKGKKAPN